MVGEFRSEADGEAKRGLNVAYVLVLRTQGKLYGVNLKLSRSAIGDPALIGRSKSALKRAHQWSCGKFTSYRGTERSTRYSDGNVPPTLQL